MKLEVQTLAGDSIQLEAGPQTTIAEIQTQLAEACQVPPLCQRLTLTLRVDTSAAMKLLKSSKQAKQLEGLSALAQLGPKAAAAAIDVGKIAADPVLPETLTSKAMDTLQIIVEGNA